MNQIEVPTPHNAAKLGEIAKTVLMPGDPLRAKYIAEHYLTDVELYTQVRGMYGFTGNYKGVRISVQGSGMGVPSMGIYSKELYDGYGVENIIRIGSAGALDSSVELRDIVVSETVESDSNYDTLMSGGKKLELKASSTLIEKLKKIASVEQKEIKIGKTFTSDIFYSDKKHLCSLAQKHFLGVEMETLALYTNAVLSGKKALSMFTISDKPIEEIALDALQRQNSFQEMMELALELAIQC